MASQLGRTPANEREVVEITALTGGLILRLKSWERTEEQQSVALAGQQLRADVGTSVVAGAMRVLCIGPSEWLVVAKTRVDPHALNVIERELATQSVALADLSDGLRGFCIEASHARELLSKGCGLDFHADRFPVGRCACTRLAQIPAVIDCVDGSSRFEIYVARSHGDYLSAWLRDAAAEWRDGS